MLNRLYDGILLTNLLLVPLSYSTAFTQTLILKETQSQDLVIILAGVWLALGLLRGKAAYARTPYNFGLLALVIWSALSLLWASDGTRTSIRDLSMIASYIAFFVLLTERLRNPRFRSKAILIVFITASIIGAISVLQFFKLEKILLARVAGHQPLGNFAGVFLPRVTEPRISIASTIGHNISVATYFMVMGFVTLAYLLTAGLESENGKTRNRKAIFAGAFLAFCTFLILISQTRGVYLAFPPGLFAAWILVACIKKRSKHGLLINPVADSAWARLTMLILIGGLAVCLAGVVIQKSGKIDLKTRLGSLAPKVLRPDTRIRLWAISLEMIRDYPLSGAGISTFKIHYPDYQARYFQEYPDSRLTPTPLHSDQAHNEYLQIPVELGPVGLALFLSLILVHLKFLWRSVRSPAGSRAAQGRIVRQAVLGAGVLAILVDAFASFYFHVVSDALMLVFLGSLLVALSPTGSARTLNLENLGRRRSLRPILLVGILLATVFGGHFGPGLVTWYLPSSGLSTLRGPVAHALGDSIYNQATRRFTESAQFEAQIKASEASKPPIETFKSYRALAAYDRDTLASLQKAYVVAPYRGQIPYLQSRVQLHLSSIYYSLSHSLGLVNSPEEQKQTFAAAIQEAEAARMNLNDATKEYRYHAMYDFLSSADMQLALLRRLEFEKDQLQLAPDQQKRILSGIESLVREGIAMLEKASRIYPREGSYLEKLLQYYVDGDNLEGVMRTLVRLRPLDPDYVKSTLTKPVADILDRVRNIRFYGDRDYWKGLLDAAEESRRNGRGEKPWSQILADMRNVSLAEEERNWPSLLDDAWAKKGEEPWNTLLRQSRNARVRGDETRAANLVRKQQTVLRKGWIPLLAAYEFACRGRDFDEILTQGRLLFECERFLGKTEEAENLALEINRLGKNRPDTMVLFYDCYFPDRLHLFEQRLVEELAARDKGTLDRPLLFKFAILDALYGRLGQYDGAVEMWEKLKKQPMVKEIRPLLDLWQARDLWLCGRFPESLGAIGSAAANSGNQDPRTRNEVGQSVLRDFSSLLLPILES
jgi:O-antigen ligase